MVNIVMWLIWGKHEDNMGQYIYDVNMFVFIHLCQIVFCNLPGDELVEVCLANQSNDSKPTQLIDPSNVDQKAIRNNKPLSHKYVHL